MQQIIVRPIITEKTMQEAGRGKFTFVVATSAGKHAIKQAVEETFSVHVTDIATIVVKGRTQRVGIRRQEQQLSAWKKAVVTLKPGEKIALFDLGA